jgi:LmbE family N-acetylglucosaminyl deacetylase
MSGSRFSTATGAALLCVVALLIGGGESAAAAGPCTGSAIYIAAHEDDTLLFQSPALLEDVRANKCVRTVFTTAGDAGKAAKYWEGREAGAEAGYADMAGVANAWTGSQINVKGHSIQLETLSGQPGISIAYMRLPDGGVNGLGFPAYGNQSLMKLWNGAHAEMPAIGSIEAVDKSTGYTYAGLIDTLTELIEGFAPLGVETQNYQQAFIGPDHPDHVGTAKFVELAQDDYAAAHLLRGFEDYESPAKPVNVFEPLLGAKEAAFSAYIPFDEACLVDEDCEAAPYTEWLPRQYVAATESTPGALAGPSQTVVPGAAVQLDGSASFDPGKLPLQYAWTQTTGPKVTLSGVATPTPSFNALPNPTNLSFSLTVANGVRESLPAGVTVAVKNPAPPEPPKPPTPPAPPQPPTRVKVTLSKSRVELLLGKRSRDVVKVTAPSASLVICRGGLPKGAHCRVNAQREVIVEATKSVKRAGAFHLTIRVSGASGSVQRRLTVIFRRPSPRGAR